MILKIKFHIRIVKTKIGCNYRVRPEHLTKVLLTHCYSTDFKLLLMYTYTAQLFSAATRRKYKPLFLVYGFFQPTIK